MQELVDRLREVASNPTTDSPPPEIHSQSAGRLPRIPASEPLKKMAVSTEAFFSRPPRADPLAARSAARAATRAAETVRAIFEESDDAVKVRAVAAVRASCGRGGAGRGEGEEVLRALRRGLGGPLGRAAAQGMSEAGEALAELDEAIEEISQRGAARRIEARMRQRLGGGGGGGGGGETMIGSRFYKAEIREENEGGSSSGFFAE